MVADWPLGAFDFILIVDTSEKSKFSNVAEFGWDSTSVMICENVVVPSDAVALWWPFACSSATLPRLIAILPLLSNPIEDNCDDRLTSPAPPFAAFAPFSVNAA